MPDEMKLDDRGVLVALSGGVDSAVAALLLKAQGYHVVGVTLRLWSEAGSQDRRAGAGSEAIARAARIARRLNIRHLVVDAADTFYCQVVEYFVQEYALGRTPNPCVKCNSRLRFALLLEIAQEQGLARIATGHYARLMGDPPGLGRGIDKSKDQSYVLAEVSPQLLAQTLLPLGNMTKTEVRRLAAEVGLEEYATPESQEICFIADDDHERFLRERLGPRPGLIVDRHGRELGRHTGTYNFTIGQRKGLGIAWEKPLYVQELIAAKQEVIVGTAEETAVGRIVIDEAVYHRPTWGEPLVVQWRSSGGTAPAHMADARTIVLKKPAIAVSPGQTAVVYQGDAVVVAGTIRATEPWPRRHFPSQAGGSKQGL